MMRATAGLQMTCDFVDRADAGRRLALLNRLVPVLMAITANSRRVAGRDSGYASYRHVAWWGTDHSRVGVPDGGFDASTAVAGYVRFAKQAVALFVVGRDGSPVGLPGALPFEDLVRARCDLTDADLELHLSSLFPFVRLRNYLEIRCFDSTEWPLARSVLALLSGIVYCDRATAAAEQISAPLAIRDAQALRDLHLDAARRGLACAVPGGPSFRELARELVRFAQATLGRDRCDWAEPDDLELVRQRVEG
jgi:glutamate--cysteine ligase